MGGAGVSYEFRANAHITRLAARGIYPSLVGVIAVDAARFEARPGKTVSSLAHRCNHVQMDITKRIEWGAYVSNRAFY